MMEYEKVNQEYKNLMRKFYAKADGDVWGAVIDRNFQVSCRIEELVEGFGEEMVEEWLLDCLSEVAAKFPTRREGGEEKNVLPLHES